MSGVIGITCGWWEAEHRHMLHHDMVQAVCGVGGIPLLIPTVDAEKARKYYDLIDALVFYNVNKRWFLWTATVMPDHLHFIATFDLSYGIKKTIHQWKAYQTREHGVDFQTDFFEHRIRNQTEFIEKATYIRMNPVRKGLASTPETWPYYWICKQ